MKKSYLGLAALLLVSTVSIAQTVETNPNTKKNANFTHVKIDKKNVTPISVTAPSTVVATPQTTAPAKKEEDVKSTTSKKNQPKQK